MHTFADIDECLLGTAECHHGCMNTEGNYICTCNDGYQLHHNDLTMCVGMWYEGILLCFKMFYMLYKTLMSVWSPMEDVNKFVWTLMVATIVHVILDMYLEQVITIVKVLVLCIYTTCIINSLLIIEMKKVMGVNLNSPKISHNFPIWWWGSIG